MSDQKTVIVTGAAGGIGRSCVEGFLKAGARVVGADLPSPLTALTSAYPSDRFVAVPTDIGNDSSVSKLMQIAVEKFGSIDVLVNNAAVLGPEKPVEETTNEEFRRLMDVNIGGTFLCCKLAYPHLKKSRGCVVNVSSMTGVTGAKRHAVYSATKGAMNALTQSMAVDWGKDGIRCNAVCPSSVLTPNVNDAISKLPDAEKIVTLRKQITVLGYTASSDEIASVVVFLASPAASFMTGAIVPVSGGSECGYGIKL